MKYRIHVVSNVDGEKYYGPQYKKGFFSEWVTYREWRARRWCRVSFGTLEECEAFLQKKYEEDKIPKIDMSGECYYEYVGGDVQ